ncbi:hypothetical protein HanRHA438_Chr11g0497911 [Helianthus annuus]|nr:hypothetical protein HanRHA438_Chr11g0497911 [Helianthus annuus]
MSELDLQIPSTYVPFAESNAEDSAAESKDYVHIRIQQRNGRKSLTYEHTSLLASLLLYIRARKSPYAHAPLLTSEHTCVGWRMLLCLRASFHLRASTHAPAGPCSSTYLRASLHLRASAHAPAGACSYTHLRASLHIRASTHALAHAPLLTIEHAPLVTSEDTCAG